MKLSLLYREYQEHLKDHPQEMSEMRAKLKMNLEDEAEAGRPEIEQV
jgi:hypothetical protein